MAQTVFNIDGPIGNWGYSKQMINQMLAEAETNPVLVNISSLGGDVDHALAIHDAFVNYQHVDARLSGFVASSATIIASGARNVVMNSTAFFLIHKVSGWIDEFGFKNEDELQQLIDKFKNEAQENKKIDLIIAQIYSKRTGKNVQDIIDLMKKETWLTADEAKEWGFVDEVVQMSAKNNELTDARVAMIEAAGLPPIPRKHENTKNNAPDHSQVINDTAETMLSKFKHFFNSKDSRKMDKTKFSPLLNAINTEDVELDKDGGCYMNAAQLEALNAAINKANEAETARQNAEAAKKKAEEDKKKADDERQKIVNSLDEINDKVKEAQDADAKVAAVKEVIANSSQGPSRHGGGDQKPQDVAWDEMDNLPHNKAADESTF